MSPYACAIAECKHPPFDNARALGVHKRRKHGIAAGAPRSKRPIGGTFRCSEPGCTADPYRTAAGLGLHRRRKHGLASENPHSVERRKRRDKARGFALPQPQPKQRPPVPPHPLNPAVERRQAAGVTPGAREALRRRLHHLVTGPWPQEFGLSPEELRDAVMAIAADNFKPPAIHAVRTSPGDAYAQAGNAKRARAAPADHR